MATVAHRPVPSIILQNAGVSQFGDVDMVEGYLHTVSARRFAGPFHFRLEDVTDTLIDTGGPIRRFDEIPKEESPVVIFEYYESIHRDGVIGSVLQEPGSHTRV